MGYAHAGEVKPGNFALFVFLKLHKACAQIFRHKSALANWVQSGSAAADMVHVHRAVLVNYIIECFKLITVISALVALAIAFAYERVYGLVQANRLFGRVIHGIVSAKQKVGFQPARAEQVAANAGEGE